MSFYRIVGWVHSNRKEATANDYQYSMSGFNEYGDEVKHYQYPEDIPLYSYSKNNQIVDKEFMYWLKEMIDLYRAAGCKVVLIPPVCTDCVFEARYNNGITEALHKIGETYIVEPKTMVLSDDCMWNGAYHLNRKGTTLNTLNIISAIKPYLNNN